MNTWVLLTVLIGAAFGQEGDHKDCEPRQSSVSVRDVQDIYPRPIAYSPVDYTPHSTYGPPEPVRVPSRRPYPHDVAEGATIPRPVFVNPPVYNDIRSQFPLAPVYGPPPPRAKVAAAAGIYEDYEDIQYAQPQSPPAPRRYNTNYAHREPYYGYDAYSGRHHEYRFPVYYAPLAVGYYPVRTPHPTPVSITTTTTEDPHTQAPPSTLPAEQSLYEDNQVKRQPPPVSSEEDYRPRPKIFKPFAGIANLFRGSIIAKRNKIGVIPSLVQGSVNRFT